MANEDLMTTTGEASKALGRPKNSRRKLIGIVVGDKMNKTRVIVVERRLPHGKYGKYMTRRARYKAHDEKNETRIGDRVEIIESRPLSRDKRWRIERLLQRPQEV